MRYSMVDAEGNLVRAQYTDNKDAAVYEGHRLVEDVAPTPWVDYSELDQFFQRILPVPKNVTKIQYAIIDKSTIPAFILDEPTVEE